MNSPWLTLSIGLLAQVFFSARMLVQWVLSERVKQVLSPTSFWVLSLTGAYLLFGYGWLRNDFSILLGQWVAYYIYLWNLKLKGVWPLWHPLLKLVLLLTPGLAMIWVAGHTDTFAARFLQNDEVKSGLIIFGTIGQMLFTMRFVYQWWYSYRKKESELPLGFWALSLVGSSLIFIYGWIRSDAVLMIGQAFGSLAYFRNMYLWLNQKKEKS